MAHMLVRNMKLPFMKLLLLLTSLTLVTALKSEIVIENVSDPQTANNNCAVFDDGKLIVWEEKKSGQPVVVRARYRGEARTIPSDGRGASAFAFSGATLIWGTYGKAGPGLPTTYAVWAYNFESDQVVQLSENGNFPSISGNTVVWYTKFTDQPDHLTQVMSASIESLNPVDIDLRLNPPGPYKRSKVRTITATLRLEGTGIAPAEVNLESFMLMDSIAVTGATLTRGGQVEIRFDAQEVFADLPSGISELIVKGTTTSGRVLRGSASIRIYP